MNRKLSDPAKNQVVYSLSTNQKMFNTDLLASFYKLVQCDNAISVGIKPGKYVVHVPFNVVLANLKWSRVVLQSQSQMIKDMIKLPTGLRVPP